ncbi:hypothetical protein ADK55_04885 [Streptomyces sp. WM4235]|nr:hypothetical protein ADK55_04885 [Streptomyces sp. WM4235]
MIGAPETVAERRRRLTRYNTRLRQSLWLPLALPCLDPTTGLLSTRRLADQLDRQATETSHSMPPTFALTCNLTRLEAEVLDGVRR